LKESSFALPIRGTVQKSGRLVQPIQLTKAPAGTDAMLVVRADHQDVERRVLSSGTHTFLISKKRVSGKDHVKNDQGTSVPSQRLSTGALAFLAEKVPALGSASFHLSATAPHALAKRVTALDRDSKTGNNFELTSNRNTHNLVDTSSDEVVNKYLFLECSDVSKSERERVRAHHNRGTRSPRCHDPCRVFRAGM
jgi:hypothetical protein